MNRAKSILDLIEVLEEKYNETGSLEREKILQLINFSKANRDLLMFKALVIGHDEDPMSLDYAIEKAVLISNGINPLDFERQEIFQKLIEMKTLGPLKN